MHGLMAHLQCRVPAQALFVCIGDEVPLYFRATAYLALQPVVSVHPSNFHREIIFLYPSLDQTGMEESLRNIYIYSIFVKFCSHIYRMRPILEQPL